MRDGTLHLDSVDLVGGRVLMADGSIAEADIFIADGKIAGIGGSRQAHRSLDAKGHLILPGIVDLHGDVFERQLMPRPGIQFDQRLALIDTDRQLVANGVTTAYHGLSWSWEPGLRDGSSAVAFMAALDQVRPRLLADTRLHLRHETFNVEAEQQLIAWMDQGRIDLLSFNDHTVSIAEKIEKREHPVRYAGRSELTEEEFRSLFDLVMSRAGEVESSIERLAREARSRHIPIASHNDSSPTDRAWFHSLGSRLCEFPCDIETAFFAIANGDAVIMGAPNAVRGKSHYQRPAAGELAKAGLCTILASDYYYPALLHAPFTLVREGKLDFAKAWSLVSEAPARALGHSDRGSIAEGLRADLVLVDDTDPQLPMVAATMTEGRMAFCAHLGH
ncbi:Amidohydrolase [Rhodospirillaceae bacterium LM-1]|nr:Amidohydrolase [Rhodospirillaceae bacterium LM-1]